MNPNQAIFSTFIIIYYLLVFIKKYIPGSCILCLVVSEVTAANCVTISYLTILATDKCASDDTNNCDGNATCTGTDSSYTCTCKDGWTGNGFTCSRK